MGPIPVIAIVDVGKTNKKLVLFDESYKILYETAADLSDVLDEDGFPCEDIVALTEWMIDSIDEVLALPSFNIKAINFSAHGASFVHLDAGGKVIAPLYNYLKPYPDSLRKKFYDAYGGEIEFSQVTASPVLGNLNSGMQLYRMKYEQPALNHKIKYSLHLPQYLSFLLTHKAFSDITSIGCHTGLWDFRKNDYHRWVRQEGISNKLAPIRSCDTTIQVEFMGQPIPVGIGLHDSSAALIPYLKQSGEDFVLLSTGTWAITLNPFNTHPLTELELAKDCLCYLNYQGKPVKASRLFAGHAHQQQVERITEYFHQKDYDHNTILYDQSIVEKLNTTTKDSEPASLVRGDFFTKDLSVFKSFNEAYHQLIMDLVGFQKTSTSLVLKAGTKKLFVDGGFSKNRIFMNLLSKAFPSLEVYAASLPQASALGAAMIMHSKWTKNDLPENNVPVNRV